MQHAERHIVERRDTLLARYHVQESPYVLPNLGVLNQYWRLSELVTAAALVLIVEEEAKKVLLRIDKVVLSLVVIRHLFKEPRNEN